MDDRSIELPINQLTDETLDAVTGAAANGLGALRDIAGEPTVPAGQVVHGYLQICTYRSDS
jgi:hypothetical protein